MECPQRNFASSPALLRVINSDSIMDLAIHVYLECFNDTFIPPNMKTYPLVNFESLVSDINLASLYHFITVG
jgi:hypothetical protein